MRSNKSTANPHIVPLENNHLIVAAGFITNIGAQPHWFYKMVGDLFVLKPEGPCGFVNCFQKIYNVDPLLCPKCFGSMRIIAFIEDQLIVKKILQHLDLWHVKRKPPPRSNDPPTEAIIIYDESSAPSADDPPSVLLLWRDTSACGPVASTRHVT